MGLGVRELFGRFSRRDRYGLFVDGPNVLREEFAVDLHTVREAVEEVGQVSVARLFLNHRASPGLIQAGEAAGFAIDTTSGDVDVALAVAATTAVETMDLDGLAIASRDIDFKPVLELASRRGLQTFVICPGAHGRSDGLTNSADRTITLGEA